jgi:hypothetical protein
MKKIVRESIADKFTKQDPYLAGVPDEFDNFDKKYQSQQRKVAGNGEVFYKRDDWQIIKNPQDLKQFEKNVKGVIINSGDLFIEISATKIHNDILRVLQEKELIPQNIKKNWGNTLPSVTKFITVQRFKDTNIIALGESNRLLYAQSNYRKYIEYYIPFLKRAKEKCKNIDFSEKLIGVKIHKDNDNTATNIVNK